MEWEALYTFLNPNISVFVQPDAVTCKLIPSPHIGSVQHQTAEGTRQELL